jgi:radical SAM superfamily enzyme YgiQ (UPF0313 family)
MKSSGGFPYRILPVKEYSVRVLLISANTEFTNMAPLPLGLNCVAVATRNEGHDVRMLDLMGSSDSHSILRDSLDSFRPDVIGFSVRNIDDQNMAEPKFLLEPVRGIIDFCRNLSGAPIVIGGAGYSIFPESALRYLNADYGIRGDGEAAFTELLRALGREEPPTGITGLYLPSGKAQGKDIVRPSFATLPLPDPSLWNTTAGREGDLWVPFQTRRGCPLACSYCSTPAIEGTRIRKRTIEEVLQGIAAHVAAGFDRFYFVDSAFNLPPSYTKALCGALSSSKLDIRWRCILYPGFVDEELVRMMAKAGCVEVSLGFESGCPAMLRNFNKKFNLNQVRAAAEMLKDHGISGTGFLLLGGPGETRDSVWESLTFADSLKLDLLKITSGIRIYPGTALEKIAWQEGMIPKEDDLLFPRFYLAKGLDGWIEPMLSDWMAERPFRTF